MEKMNNGRVISRITAVLLIMASVSLFSGCQNLQSSAPAAQDSAKVMTSMKSQADLKTAMRKLWSDHVIWTRLYIIAAAAGTEDATPAATRLLKNQEDIGAAIVPYYGKEAGDKLASLLKEHITIAVDIIAAAKVGDNDKVTTSSAAWKKNAEDIATFLSSANPNWSKDMLVNMLNSHLTLTTDEVLNRLQSKWNDEPANFDKIYDQAMEMADGLSDGIIKQFPEKF